MIEYQEVGAGPNLRRIAVRYRPGRSPCLVWFSGFQSTMNGTKAEAIDALAGRNGHACLRFDYSGHGESSGDFVMGTLSRWLEEAVAVIRARAGSKPVYIGSSMGGWIALLATLRLRAGGEAGDPRGIVLVAPAVDFTERILWRNLGPSLRQAIEDTGRVVVPAGDSSSGYVITRELVHDGRRHLLLSDPIQPACPVHILQGMRDAVIPWGHALATLEGIQGCASSLTLIRDGDHRLSRDQDIRQMLRIVEAWMR